MKLDEVFDAITRTETKLIPVLITNPQSQEIAGIAFVLEQGLFALISKLHASKPAPAAPAAPAAPVAPVAA